MNKKVLVILAGIMVLNLEAHACNLGCDYGGGSVYYGAGNPKVEVQVKDAEGRVLSLKDYCALFAEGALPKICSVDDSHEKQE